MKTKLEDQENRNTGHVIDDERETDGAKDTELRDGDRYEIPTSI